MIQAQRREGGEGDESEAGPDALAAAHEAMAHFESEEAMPRNARQLEEMMNAMIEGAYDEDMDVRSQVHPCPLPSPLSNLLTHDRPALVLLSRISLRAARPETSEPELEGTVMECRKQAQSCTFSSLIQGSQERNLPYCSLGTFEVVHFMRTRRITIYSKKRINDPGVNPGSLNSKKVVTSKTMKLTLLLNMTCSSNSASRLYWRDPSTSQSVCEGAEVQIRGVWVTRGGW